jgi:hypothetical protein
MKKGYTHIEVVLDASGSMDLIKKDTIGGFNSFLEGQKETASVGDTFTFTTFSSGYGGAPPWKNIYKNARISDVPPLTNSTYKCNGGTALLDTLGDSIKYLGAFLHQLPEEQRPSKVVFVILTDGEENSSHSYSKHNINAMIKTQTDDYKWEFVFLGANQDAIQVGATIGIAAASSMSYGANEIGVKSTFESLTRSLNTYKAAPVGMNFAASGAAFTVGERSASMGGVLAGNTDNLLFSGGVGYASSSNTSEKYLNTSGNPFYVPPVIPTAPVNTSKIDNVKDDGHSVTVETVKINAGVGG